MDLSHGGQDFVKSKLTKDVTLQIVMSHFLEVAPNTYGFTFMRR